MSLFGNLTTTDLEKTTDQLGGRSLKESDVYEATIKYAYAGESDGGAMSVTVVADIAGQEYNETVYITNKNKENFFRNKQDQTKKIPLPGFTTINDICMVTTEKSLDQQPTEDKIINIYDFDSKKNVPKSVPVLTALMGTKVYLGILKQLENKSDKVGNEYVPNAETRETNIINKVFHYPSKMTLVEATEGTENPVFHDAWLEKNKGKTIDRRTVKDGQGGAGVKTGKPGGAPQAGAEKKTTSLFGK